MAESARDWLGIGIWITYSTFLTATAVDLISVSLKESRECPGQGALVRVLVVVRQEMVLHCDTGESGTLECQLLYQFLNSQGDPTIKVTPPTKDRGQVLTDTGDTVDLFFEQVQASMECQYSRHTTPRAQVSASLRHEFRPLEQEIPWKSWLRHEFRLKAPQIPSLPATDLFLVSSDRSQHDRRYMRRRSSSAWDGGWWFGYPARQCIGTREGEDALLVPSVAIHGHLPRSLRFSSCLSHRELGTYMCRQGSSRHRAASHHAACPLTQTGCGSQPVIGKELPARADCLEPVDLRTRRYHSRRSRPEHHGWQAANVPGLASQANHGLEGNTPGICRRGPGRPVPVACQGPAGPWRRDAGVNAYQILSLPAQRPAGRAHRGPRPHPRGRRDAVSPQLDRARAVPAQVHEAGRGGLLQARCVDVKVFELARAQPGRRGEGGEEEAQSFRARALLARRYMSPLLLVQVCTALTAQAGWPSWLSATRMMTSSRTGSSAGCRSTRCCWTAIPLMSQKGSGRAWIQTILLMCLCQKTNGRQIAPFLPTTRSSLEKALCVPKTTSNHTHRPGHETCSAPPTITPLTGMPYQDPNYLSHPPSAPRSAQLGPTQMPAGRQSASPSFPRGILSSCAGPYSPQPLRQRQSSSSS